MQLTLKVKLKLAKLRSIVRYKKDNTWRFTSCVVFFYYLNMSSPEFNGFFSSPTKVVKFSFELATSVGFIVFQFRYNNK
ncbi:hypothetical protein DYR28_14335 [Bacillus cereus]|nr:hypothetical protein DYR28_14335 [Bacillus cereus]